jgi:hypothetical protein
LARRKRAASIKPISNSKVGSRLLERFALDRIDVSTKAFRDSKKLIMESGKLIMQSEKLEAACDEVFKEFRDKRS